ncbi:MAG: PAS domain S-box protein [Gammaproteobacteria bacterium]|jgi:two-component system sensor kinase FixL|nr:PAS domain S-box protein [Gammaproteobacteria bacterium]
MTDVNAKSESSLQALLDAAVDAIIVADHSGCIETFNRAAEDIFGYTEAEILGQNLKVLMPEPYAREHDRYMSNYQSTGIPRIIGLGREVTGRHKSGRTFPVELSVGHAISEGQPHYVGIIRDIRERKTIERALLLERDRAQNYLDLADVILLGLDTQGRITLINRRGCEVLGYQESELLGKDWFLTCIPGNKREEVRRLFGEIVSGSRPGHQISETYALNRFGARRLISWRNALLRDEHGNITGTLSSGDDVTVRRQTENQLRLREEELNLIFENAPLGTMTLDLNGRLLTFNNALCKLLHTNQDELIGYPFIDAVHHEDRGRAQSLLESLTGEMHADATSMRCRMLTRTNETIHVELSAGAVHDASERPEFLIVQIQDFTDRVRSEEEAGELRERLTHVARLSTLGEMAAGIAHEINQPLTAISTYAQAGKRFLAQNHVDVADLSETFSLMDKQAQRAAEVIRGLRRLVRQKTTKREHLDCNQLVRDIVKLAETDIKNHNVKISLQLAPNLPKVAADSVQLQQVLLNLIRNALEAIRDSDNQGNIVIKTDTPSPEWIKMTVQDNGPGIADEMLANVFSPFKTSKEAGMGLGLSISRSIANAHGGELTFENNPEGDGASFFFTLPTVPSRD